jgi:hypothetical protein
MCRISEDARGVKGVASRLAEQLFEDVPPFDFEPAALDAFLIEVQQVEKELQGVASLSTVP